MNHWKLIGTLTVVGLAAQPLAAWSGSYRGGDDGFYINAPVTRVEPLYSYVNVSTPQEVCWDEPVYQPTNTYRSATPLVLGGILGGALGSELSRHRSSRSRDLVTVAGALLGASVGRDQANRHRAPARRYVTTQRLCEIEHVTHQEQRFDGYRVHYKYRGRHFTTETATDPGSTIRVRVQVEPVAYNDGGRQNGRKTFRSRRYEG